MLSDTGGHHLTSFNGGCHACSSRHRSRRHPGRRDVRRTRTGRARRARRGRRGRHPPGGPGPGLRTPLRLHRQLAEDPRRRRGGPPLRRQPVLHRLHRRPVRHVRRAGRRPAHPAGARRRRPGRPGRRDEPRHGVLAAAHQPPGRTRAVLGAGARRDRQRRAARRPELPGAGGGTGARRRAATRTPWPGPRSWAAAPPSPWTPTNSATRSPNTSPTWCWTSSGDRSPRWP